jgi:Putative restriction endonuclease
METYGFDPSDCTFSVSKYQKMIEVGILTKDDKVELLEEHIVLKFSRTPLHDGTLQLAHKTLDELIPNGWLLRNQATVALEDSQPEPDLSVVRGDLRTFLSRHAGPAETGLLIEVADLSLLRDQRDKMRIYARANVPVYWIIASRFIHSHPARSKCQRLVPFRHSSQGMRCHSCLMG